MCNVYVCVCENVYARERVSMCAFQDGSVWLPYTPVRSLGMGRIIEGGREGQSEVGIKNHDYSHGGLDIGNGVLSTNTVLPVILQVHLLGRG